MKKTITVSFILILSVLFCSCAQTEKPEQTPGDFAQEPPIGQDTDTVCYEADEWDLDERESSPEMTMISFLANGASVFGEGVQTDGSLVTVTQSGMYYLSGECPDGRLRVDLEAGGFVKLVFAGLKLSGAFPVEIVHAEKAVVTLAAGTENAIFDTGAIVEERSGANAAFFSDGNLSINGSGSLSVQTAGAEESGILCGGTLAIMNGNVSVSARADAITGKSLAITGGFVSASAGADALKTFREEGNAGGICITDGTVTLCAGRTGISCADAITVGGGIFTITAGDDSSAGVQEVAGIRCTDRLTVTGGSFQVDSLGEVIRADGGVSLSGTDFRASSGTAIPDTFSSEADAQSVLIISGTIEAGQTLALYDGAGEVLLRFTLARDACGAVLSCPQIHSGGDYVLYRDAEKAAEITVRCAVTECALSES